MKPYWRGLGIEDLGGFGVYKLWRVDRFDLQRRAREITASGINSNWRDPRPERF